MNLQSAQEKLEGICSYNLAANLDTTQQIIYVRNSFSLPQANLTPDESISVRKMMDDWMRTSKMPIAPRQERERIVIEPGKN